MKKGDVKTAVAFHINGQKHTVDSGSDVGARSVLVDYIRDVAHLKGTKVMCREGGCGACTVTAKVIDPATGSEVIKSVNSCLTPVLSCDGWDISTVENLGNKQEGYHVVQNRLVNFNGTQCGYCTPGMVMNMYSLLESKKNVGVEDVEKNLDGNICRCTGYRPILEAFKSLAKDAPTELQKKCSDIEDCTTCPLKQTKGQVSCCGKAVPSASTEVKLPTGENWVTAKTLETALVSAVCNGAVRFVAGNTSTGIFKNEGPYKKFIDINGIPELRKTNVDNKGITIGGGTTLTELINLLRDAARLPGLEYGNRMALHLERVANVSVRNNGTIAGNLMIKHKYHWFPSDVFVMLEAIAATITLVSVKGTRSITGCDKVTIEELKPMSILDFLSTDMNMKLIKSINLPKHEGCHYRSFKITRRYQNAHAYVNAAFLLKVNKSNGFTVEGKPRLVYGGISDKFVHAKAAEAALQGKSLADEKTLKLALDALEKEVKPEEGPLESAPAYRMQLVKGLLYKTMLEIIGEKVGEKIKSGASDIVRNISSSKQVIDAEPTNTSLYKNVPKYEGGIQASGEAEYTGDIPVCPNELFAAFVQSTVACADLKEIDATEALKIPGVVRLVTAKDIPGENDAKLSFWPNPTVDPVFVVDKVQYYGQSLGLILATTRELALKAAKLVKVTYDNVQKPVVTIDKAMEKAKAAGTYPMQTMGLYKTEPRESHKVAHTLKGSIRSGSQYHFYMETQSVICHPREDGIDIFCSTQSMDIVQNTVALVLGIPTNSINLQVRRVGGGFGGKISRPTPLAAACAVATWVTNRPVRLILDLETNMTLFGKRLPHLMPYEVGFDDSGRIGSLKVDFIADSGHTMNEPNGIIAASHVQNVYKAVGWEVDTHTVTTNTPSNTACRAPGSVKAVAVIEWVMDRIASYLKMDPIVVRQNNLLEKRDPMVVGAPFGHPTFERDNLIPEMIERMKKTADYDARRAFVEKFNKENRWKKRGMSVVPVRYGIDYWATAFPVSIAIYHQDGHVAVSQGGIEMGQGLNTKVIQTVSQALGIPMDRVKVKPSNNFVGANSFPSGGSVASEVVCYSAMRACEEIRENLRPILEKLENPEWEKLIKEANTAKVKLTASYTPTAKDEIKGYDVWIINLVEVEIDVLTGENKVVRSDLYEDTGKSLSPGIDLGQIEGGYIMGQGYWTTEKIVHDENTGKLLTNGTWDYKVPETKDIPEDFRITLLANAPNPHGVLRSKATGEPSVDAAYAVVLAMRAAIASARQDAGNNDWFDMDGPVTPEDIARLCLTKEAHLTY